MLPQPLRTLLPSHPPTPIATRPPCCLPSGAYPFAASLRIKLMAVYLAEDINATTLQPLYGARIPGVVPDTGTGPEGEISPLQRLRRARRCAAAVARSIYRPSSAAREQTHRPTLGRGHEIESNVGDDIGMNQGRIDT